MHQYLVQFSKYVSRLVSWKIDKHLKNTLINLFIKVFGVQYIMTMIENNFKKWVYIYYKLAPVTNRDIKPHGVFYCLVL